MGIEFSSGTLYFGSEPVGEIYDGSIECDEGFYIPSEHPYIKCPSEFEVTFNLDELGAYKHRKILLMLYYGPKITNNWLKYHGGVITRQRAYLKHLRNKRREK